ncbi:MAG: rod shape-determining protein RodA [Candidatus Moranbacteria bacterium]|nr:rod shape-determining protein RodA [Candidatus Moranbacteria bacterium]NTW76043.1 rod shape-determining protein RodA [Candidatus Moranbacteria bacterium]
MVKRFLETDWLLVLSALFVFGAGLLSLYSLSVTGDPWSLSGSYFLRQVVFGVIGIALMFFFQLLDYRHLLRFGTHFYFLALAALVLVLVFGRTVNGTSGWISLGFVRFQPVEAVKIALILFLARFIIEKRSELGEWVRIIASLVLSSFLIFLVLKQPDLGSALTLMAIWGGMILVTGIRVRHMFVLLFMGIAVALTGWFFLEEYQRDRIDIFLHPESDPRGSGYNVLQAMVAVGSGGVTGKGVGYGSQSQLNFLPEKHTDFIFATVTEELGLVGAGTILLAYGVFLFRSWRIAEHARDNAGYLIAVGAQVYFMIQIFINIGMNIGLLPVAGLPAPFLSYGGSSLVASFVIMGLLLNVYRQGHHRHQLSFGTISSSEEISLL